jgi:hypothetical protein
MVQITGSTARFAWAQTVFGAQQVLNALASGRAGRSAGKAASACDTVALVAGDQLGNSLKGVYNLGDLVQRGVVDVGFDLLSGRVPGSDSFVRPADALRQAGDVVRFLAAGGDVALAWQEFQQKLEVFQWVRNVNALLRLPADGSYVPLTELVGRAYARGPFAALWAVEGAGHYYAVSLWGRDAPDPRGLLTDARSASVTDSSLTMLHAGIGLAFAERLLEGVTPATPGSEVRRVLQRFLDLCRANSRPGYVGAALESLGLVTRVFHPRELVRVVDRELAPLDAEALAYFWHGVGRALYFAPTYFLPFGASPWRAVTSGAGEVWHELGRLNAVAGLAWAVTLVNMRRPQIVEAVVRKYAAELSRDDAFANGVSSAIVMRNDTTPGEPFVTEFCRHRSGETPAARRWWGRLVREPCEEARMKFYPALKAAGRLGEVFRYRQFPERVKDCRNPDCR